MRNSNLLPNEIHHNALEVKIEIETQSREVLLDEVYVRDFRKTDFVALNELIADVDWNSLFANSDVNSSVNLFYEKIEQFFSACVPLKKVTSSAHPKYFDKCLINLKNRTNKAHKAYKSGRCEYQVYSDLRKEFKRYSVVAYERYVERTENEIRVNPRRFFSYVDEKKKIDKLPQKMCYADKESSDPREISNMFVDHFRDGFCGR